MLYITLYSPNNPTQASNSIKNAPLTNAHCMSYIQTTASSYRHTLVRVVDILRIFCCVAEMQSHEASGDSFPPASSEFERQTSSAITCCVLLSIVTWLALINYGSLVRLTWEASSVKTGVLIWL